MLLNVLMLTFGLATGYYLANGVRRETQGEIDFELFPEKHENETKPTAKSKATVTDPKTAGKYAKHYIEGLTEKTRTARKTKPTKAKKRSR